MPRVPHCAPRHCGNCSPCAAAHMKTSDDLFETRSNPLTESMVAAGVQWAEKIMRKFDGAFAAS
jgi:hypothetical protein